MSNSNMQPEQPHGHGSDPAPLPPPSPTLFRRPEAPQPSSSLRHRLPRSAPEAQIPDSLSMRIRVHSPMSDSGSVGSGSKEGWLVSKQDTVGKLKDDLASGGLDGAGIWERDGMRIVYQGKIVRDHERLGDVVGKQMMDSSHVYTFHLVARRVPGTPEVPLTNPMETHSAVSETSAPSAAAPASAAIASVSINSVALADSVHYLLFWSRYHIFRLLGTESLEWQETVPPPVVSQEEARMAVMSVVEGYARLRQQGEEGWDKWEIAFASIDKESMKGLWDSLGGREAVEKEVCNLWSGLLGKNWTDREKGESAEIELDGTVYQLNLPALSACTPTQLIHLLLYLRISSLVPLLNAALYEARHQESLTPTPLPTPTPIIPAAARPSTPHARIIYHRTFRFNLLLPSRAVLVRFVVSSMKLAMMMWMLTRGMKWTDIKFWVIAGVGLGWWIVDVFGAVALQVRQRQIEAIAQRVRNGAGIGQAGEAGGAEAPGVTGRGAAAPPNRPANAPDRTRPPPAFSTILTNTLVPHVHLATDDAQLHLRRSRHSSNSFATPPRTRPGWLQTQLLLPIFLWVITLIPGWESVRARRIRRRNRNIRAAVASSNPDMLPPGEGQDGSQYVLPTGLSEQATRYYRSVLSVGETIDWEEEREAQRALGVGEED